MSDVIYPSAVVENDLPIFCSIIAEMPWDEIPWKILGKCGKFCAYCVKGSICLLKVSRSQNKIVEPKLLPKNERTNLFFYPDDSEILET